MKTRAYISVGSNVEPVRHIQGALRALAKRYGPVQVSRTYQTPAAGFAGEDFLNLVLGIETDDLAGLVARMKANGFEFRNPIRDEPRFRYVMVAGPDNLLIELFQSREPERWKIAG